jgi:MFS family permease
LPPNDQSDINSDLVPFAMSEDKERKYDSRYAYRTLALFALLAASVMYVEIMLTPSLPAIRSQYNVTEGQVSLILALYTVFGTAINPVVGKLGDLYGKKRILLFVLIAYSIMVTLTSFAPSFNVLLLTRTFQGIGLGIFPLAFSLVREEFPTELVPKAQGMISAMFGAGIALGLPLGAFVANSYGWQANYHLATPVIIILTIIIAFEVKESVNRVSNARLDYVGAVLLGTALGLVVLGLSEGSVWGWTSLSVLGFIFGGLVLFIPLVPYELRMGEAAILNLRQLRVRNVLVSNIIGVIVGLGMLLAFQSIVFQLEDIKPAGFGFDILTTGIYLLPLAIVMLILAYPIGILISKIGVKPFLILGSIIGALGFFLISEATTAIQISEYLAIASVGLAMEMVAMQNLLVLSVKRLELGLATSMNTAFRNVGQSLGAPIAGSILSTFTFTAVYEKIPLTVPSTTAFHYTYYVAAIAFIVGLVVSLFAHEVMGRNAKKKTVVIEE